ncbi:hypothetical protein [Pseudoalteromonas rubra]|nr:hypothetical protein [Pseudoalteromonas rubra]
MTKPILLSMLILTLAGCSGKSSDEISEANFTLSNIDISISEWRGTHLKSEVIGEVWLADENTKRATLTGNDSVILAGPGEIEITARNRSKTTGTDYCCNLYWASENISASVDGQWQLSINRQSKQIDSYPIEFPQLVELTYPVSEQDYDTFVYSGNDVIITWDPNSASDLKSYYFQIRTLKEGEKCNAKQTMVLSSDVTVDPDNFSVEEQLIIPAELIDLCPSPISIEVGLSSESVSVPVKSTIYGKSLTAKLASSLVITLSELGQNP